MELFLISFSILLFSLALMGSFLLIVKPKFLWNSTRLESERRRLGEKTFYKQSISQIATMLILALAFLIYLVTK